MKKTITGLSLIAGVSSILSACIGIFFTNGGTTRIVENIYGQQVELYGDGIYANNSLMKVGATKGTDAAILLIAIILLVTMLAFRNRKASILLQTGLLSIILYASTCLIMGVSFNRLFLLYVLQFGSSLFAFFLSLQHIISNETYIEDIYEKHFKGTGIFLIISSCSVLIWLMFILPTVITGQPMDSLEIYTTEPTFAIDLAIILPSTLFCGIMLYKRKTIGYKVAPVLLTLLAGVGICVIFQTIFQTSLGIELNAGQLFGLVGTFIILGMFAVVLNIRLLKYAK